MAYKPNVKLDPTLDGVTHLNIGIRSSTRLGKMLSNMSMLGFKHPRYGSFASLEGFWYWLATGKQHDVLRKLYGTQAKFKGKEFPQVHLEDFQGEFKAAMQCRLEQHQELRQLLQKNELPLTHYYWFGTEPSKAKVVDVSDKHGWQVEFYHREGIKENLFKGKAVTLLGKFEYDLDLVKDAIEQYMGGHVVNDPDHSGIALLGRYSDEELDEQCRKRYDWVINEAKLDDLLGGGMEFYDRIQMAKFNRDNQIADVPKVYPPILEDETVVFKGAFAGDWTELRNMVEAMGGTIIDAPQDGSEFTVVGQLTNQPEYDALEACGARIIPEGVLRHGNIEAIMHWRNRHYTF